MNRAFLFPGQGAQYPGMGKDFCEAFSSAREVFQLADHLLGCHFSKLIFEGPADLLTLTKNSQLAIYITSIAILRVIEQQMPNVSARFCAGLSLGEYSALTAAGNISFEACLPLVQARALFMHQACLNNPGTMRVVLGMESELVEKLVSEMRLNYAVWVANLNAPGQVVIAGKEEDLNEAGKRLLAAGAKRCLSLDVSGAFHSGLMEEAKKQLTPLILETKFYASRIEVAMNVVGDVATESSLIQQHLIDQVTHPVRWEQSIRALAAHGVEHFIEIGPGKVLSGLNKRMGLKEPTISIEKVSDLEEIACLRC